MELIVLWRSSTDAGSTIRLNEGGRGEAITLPIVVKDGRMRPAQCILGGAGHGPGPSTSAVADVYSRSLQVQVSALC